MNIAIIGGGASGVMLAHLLEKETNVTIFEKNSSLLHKVKMTGNGKGNVSNLNMDKSYYNNPTFVNNIINLLDINKLSDSLSCLLKNDEMGRIYPYFEKSNIIIDGLTLYNTNIKLNYEVKNISKKDNHYLIDGEEFDIVVIATGSDAPNKIINKNNCELIKKLGHNITYLYPSLSPIHIKDNLRIISGKRVKGSISLKYKDETYTHQGEILFKDDSLSGICVFELSSIYARNKVKNIDMKDAYLEVDLFPNIEEKELFSILLKRYKTNREPLKGLFDEGFVKFISSKVDIKNINKLTNYLKHMKFNINLDKQPDIYQVISGGVNINEINNDLSSKLNENLYFIGEVLDIDGMCGGYNLHFAFSSAYKVYLKLKGRL